MVGSEEVPLASGIPQQGSLQFARAFGVRRRYLLHQRVHVRSDGLLAVTGHRATVPICLRGSQTEKNGPGRRTDRGIPPSWRAVFSGNAPKPWFLGSEGPEGKLTGNGSGSQLVHLDRRSSAPMSRQTEAKAGQQVTNFRL